MTTAAPTSTTALFTAGRADQGAVASLLRKLGFEPVPVDCADQVGAFHDPVSLCLIDLRENEEALRVARAVRIQHPGALVIGIADPARPMAAAAAMRAGIFDVIPRPAVARDLEELIATARGQAALPVGIPESAERVRATTYGIIGASPAMRLVMDLVRRAAAGRCGIVICGERGTGREMIARAIHAHGANPAAPFVKVDCAGPASEDVELWLFGVINKRAGKGASERRSLERLGSRSLLQDAAGGVLFLENAVDLPARIQTRLVRVLRDREVLIGSGREPVGLDARPIAAMDNSLDVALDEGRLRLDLYERLSSIRIDLPPLRQRREDIPVLANHFLKGLCRANAVPLKTLSRAATTLLAALPWRANAPELRAMLERLILRVPHDLIRLEDVLAHTQLEGAISPTGLDATLRQARARFEREYIAAVLQHQRGRIAETARILGIQRTNLYRKMRRLNVIRPKASGRGPKGSGHDET